MTVTGATGLIGPRLIAALQGSGAAVTVLSRDAGRAQERLRSAGPVSYTHLTLPTNREV